MQFRFPLFVGGFGVLAIGFVVWAGAAPERALASLEAPFAGIRAGDWVFQDLECGPRCTLIREVTESRYVHVGLVAGTGDERVVWEAYRPVGPTALSEWAYRGRDHAVAVYRPSSQHLAHHRTVLAALREMRGRAYDADYQWDDERIYCSELLVKAYAAAGVELVEPHTINLGRRRVEIARRTQGRLTESTLMVTPHDLLSVPGLRRLADPLR